jgi:hypothetical protein
VHALNNRRCLRRREPVTHRRPTACGGLDARHFRRLSNDHNSRHAEARPGAEHRTQPQPVSVQFRCPAYIRPASPVAHEVRMGLRRACRQYDLSGPRKHTAARFPPASRGARRAKVRRDRHQSDVRRGAGEQRCGHRSLFFQTMFRVSSLSSDRTLAIRIPRRRRSAGSIRQCKRAPFQAETR